MSDEKKPGLAQAIAVWWRINIEADHAPQRALAAKLRRAGTGEALGHREVIDLYDRVVAADAWLGRRLRHDPAPLGALARVLAHVRQHDPKHSLAWRLGGDDPAMSPARFERLMRASDIDEVATALIRALPMAGHGCAVGRLGRDLLRWGEQGPNDWYFDYFHTSPPETQSEDDLQTEKKA
ncbi:hypothetical protein FJQ54_00715 [Sandaracinobacter neustonicus]|uniref:Type I-E CRISPR-associated protein Cse2/CasB n=1 Tax=Sandaracinobacter neustonicus TaxID=1715348 RepID=A0A501XWF7_9SPHN|nr:type I-E CRISPR-associated protein Cse2/CasB [Sandaracinobacter neustonicus]TPE64799.1 hypothetical protein FJQ54_00715 [Sandaracinobacter neustonicus]